MQNKDDAQQSNNTGMVTLAPAVAAALQTPQTPAVETVDVVEVVEATTVIDELPENILDCTVEQIEKFNGEQYTRYMEAVGEAASTEATF